MEGKLAETAPKRPLALTIGAAAATLLVVLGVLVGPSVVSCFNSEDGLGLCLRGKMADIGLAPPLPAPVVAETEAVAEEPAAEVNVATTEEAVSAEPALDVTPPVESIDVAAADNVIAATFGLLRAEPDGSVVIAGSGTPGSRIEVFANGELLGTVEVEASGDWVFVPDSPLSTGGLEITLGEEGKVGTAEQSFIVVINEDKASQPLVVASTPGQASEVLQGLTAPASTLLATADPVTSQPEVVAPEASSAETAAAPVAETETTPVTAETETTVEVTEQTDVVVATPAEAASPTVEIAETSTEIAAVTPPAAPSTPVVSEPAVQVASEPETAIEPEAVETAETSPAPAAESVSEPVIVAETPAIAPVQLADVQPTIDAIELDGQRTFFAGNGPDNGIIRLYVEDGLIGDTTIADDRWLIEAGPVLNKPSQRVRADLVQPDTGVVIARSEVDFVVNLPPTAEEPTAVADADISAADPEPASVPVEEPAEAVAPEQAATEPQPAAQTPEAETATPAAPTPAVPTMVAVSFGDAEAQRFASGKAIIRRGDNLWTIARRVYGEGVKYTTIYEANTGQIRDPDRIYPGQVFDLPVSE